jgi:hypothetical protein
MIVFDRDNEEGKKRQPQKCELVWNGQDLSAHQLLGVQPDLTH